MHWNWDDGWSGWNWMLMMIGMAAVWGFIAWAILASLRSKRAEPAAGDSAEQILARRLAAGEIDAEEYQHRLDVLRSGVAPNSK
jgi:putative membrane protein